MLQIGLGKGDVTAFKKGVGMMGYGLYHHIMMGIETPLFARAFIFENTSTGNKTCIVNCELCFITPSVKRGVLKELTRHHEHLGYTDDNLLVGAQHTHCAPSGYSFHGLYNMNAPGFIPEIYHKVVDGILEAILSAENNKKPGKVQLGSSKFAPEIPVSFNRSIRSYNQNPEVEKLPYEKRHLAVDREMTLLKFVGDDGIELGSINWFAVHTTNLPNTFLKLCSDNKGYAATYLENYMKDKNPGYLAAFAQGACGDVSARYIFNPKLPYQRGKYEGKFPDDIKSSQFNGQLQYEKALEISENISSANTIGDDIDSGMIYVDFGAVDIDPKYTNGKSGCVTSPACLGVAFLEGSKMDGPGMHPIIGYGAKILEKVINVWDRIRAPFIGIEFIKNLNRKFKAQKNKTIIIECGEKRILGTKHVHRLILPGFADELIRNIKIYGKKGALDNRPWTPQILPLQLIKVGSVGVLGIPFEITTVASWRLRKTIEDILLGKGYDRIILAPYSNAYSGYITTPEEYKLQAYEGGHNVFGQYSLNALQQKCAELANEMLKPAHERHLPQDVISPDWTDEELKKFEHFEGYYYKRVKKKEERMEKRRQKHTERLNKQTIK